MSNTGVISRKNSKPSADTIQWYQEMKEALGTRDQAKVIRLWYGENTKYNKAL